MENGLGYGFACVVFWVCILLCNALKMEKLGAMKQKGEEKYVKERINMVCRFFVFGVCVILSIIYRDIVTSLYSAYLWPINKSIWDFMGNPFFLVLVIMFPPFVLLFPAVHIIFVFISFCIMAAIARLLTIVIWWFDIYLCHRKGLKNSTNTLRSNGND